MMITRGYLVVQAAIREQGALTTTKQAMATTEKAAGLREEAGAVSHETTGIAFTEAPQESSQRRGSRTIDLVR